MFCPHSFEEKTVEYSIKISYWFEDKSEMERSVHNKLCEEALDHVFGQLKKGIKSGQMYNDVKGKPARAWWLLIY